MKYSVLERILHVERYRRIDDRPVVLRFLSSSEEGPWLTSLSKGDVVPTKLAKDGTVGQAFFECPIDEDDNFLGKLFRTLVEVSHANGWRNRASSIDEAFRLMVSLGYEPSTLIVPFDTLQQVCGSDLSEEEAERITMVRGYVVEMEQGVRVVSARRALPSGAAILTASKSFVGYYSRARDYMGVTLCRADRSLVLVNGLA